MENPVIDIIGAGLAGTEAALQLAGRGLRVRLFEMRPSRRTAVHATDRCAELVCSNSLKSMKPASAAGMLKEELSVLGSRLYEFALATKVDAGGALAVDRDAFSARATRAVMEHPLVEYRNEELTAPDFSGGAAAVIIASGPLTSDSLADWLARLAGADNLSFFDAAAPIVAAESLDMSLLFRQSRYEQDAPGDYLNAPFSKAAYERFIEELVGAERVILKDFEGKELFQACQPIEEIARKGVDAPRFGPLKPVGLTDPATGRRPWAAVQLRAENRECSAYNLVGFQTNLSFPEQRRVFRMIPGLENAEFSRYGVMHRNSFLSAPGLLDRDMRLLRPTSVPVYVAGQLSGTEGYCESMRSGLHAALSVCAFLRGVETPHLPRECAFGALLAYATDPDTVDYQPMHVNFGIMPPLEEKLRNKQKRYEAYAERGHAALASYVSELEGAGLL